MIPKCKKVIITDSFPVGAVVEWWSDIIPEGWLICNGQALNKSDYPDLYKAIGDKYTPVASSTTFNLPNHNGRAPVGVDSDDPDFGTIGAMYGEKEHKLTEPEMPSHYHTYVSPQHYYGEVGDDGNTILGTNTTTTQRWSDRATTWAGGSKSHNNTQPSIATYFIIKARQVAVTAAEVVGNLESNSLDSALSAKQGKMLNDKVTTIENTIKKEVLKQKSISLCEDILSECSNMELLLSWAPTQCLSLYTGSKFITEEDVDTYFLSSIKSIFTNMINKLIRLCEYLASPTLYSGNSILTTYRNQIENRSY